MDAVLDKTGRLNSNVEISKYCVLVMSTGTYKDGVDVPAAANGGSIAGVAQESILPNGFNDYSGGVLQITTGTAWPAGAIPSSVTGRGIAIRVAGIARCIASAAITAGAEVNIADTQGRIKAVSETGTTLQVVGTALEAAGQAGDVIRVLLNFYRRTVA